MRTIRTKIYKFEELSEEAKQNAIDKMRYSDNGFMDGYESEINASFEKAKGIYEMLENVDSYDLEQPILKGLRLYKWVINNISVLFLDKNYISKHTDGTVKNSYFQHKYNCTKKRLSKVFITDNLENCPLTGVCYDYDFLKPIIDYIKKPDLSLSNIDLFESMPSHESVWNTQLNYCNSDEYIIEEFTANNYEFTKDGYIFNS